MSRLTAFVAPKPSRAMNVFAKWLNRIVMLRGLPLLRDVPGLNRFPPFRGLANVRRFDLSAAAEDRLRALTGPGRALFIAPNHPEFFTDWMVDKELLSRVAPMAASWATNGVVNGLGPLAQKFWLANNLVAQIPGNSEPAKDYSIEWAAAGNGVLLHPEGAVGWHGDYVNALMPGTAEMALEALRRGRAKDPAFECWIAPMVSKLAFRRDVGKALAAEAGYVERRLKLEPAPAASLPERVCGVYRQLLMRDAARLGLSLDESGDFARLHRSFIDALCAELGDAETPEAALRRARRELRAAEPGEPETERKRKLADCLVLGLRLSGGWAFCNQTITQEEIAEHLKRIRNDYCKGTFRDTLNAFLPQPAGPRTAHLRLAEPIAVHAFAGDAAALTRELRTRLQRTLDALIAEPAIAGGFIRYPNPFHSPSAAVLPAQAA